MTGGARCGDFGGMPSTQPSPFDSVESAVADIAAGRMVIVTDDERRENEGDLIMAASKATTEAIGIMIRHCSGIVCVATTGEVLSRLGLGPDGCRQPGQAPDGFCGQRGRGAGRHDRDQRRRPREDHPHPRGPRRRSRAASRARATSSRSARGPAVSSSAPGTRRRPSTSPSSPASTRAASSAS